MGQKRCCLIGWGGPRALRSVVGGGQHYGATRVSIEVLKLPIKKMDCVCEQEFTERFHQFLPHGFDFFVFCFCHESTWTDVFGKRKYIYTHVTPKHYLLHWSSMIPINIQLQKRQCSGHRDGRTDKKEKHLSELPSTQVFQDILSFWSFKNLLVFFFFLFYLNAHRWHYGEKALRCLPFFFFFFSDAQLTGSNSTLNPAAVKKDR